MPNTKTINHVIFLGAGASQTSGYPLASELRLRLTSQNQILADLERLADDAKAVSAECSTYFNRFYDSAQLFRHGAFGSVDEFSKLASEKYPEHVQAMKNLTRLALSLHYPEKAFHHSDYYPFIQHLFSEDHLYSLKPNIAVLSYNYDCYLEYLLLKAQAIRNNLAGQPQSTAVHKNRLSSGFFKPSDSNILPQLAQADGQFKHLKLHGSIAFADEKSHKQLFESANVERFKPFSVSSYPLSTPPIVFPWEVFDASGNFIDSQEFIFCKQARASGNGVLDPQANNKHAQAMYLYELYKAIWEGARQVVQRADKISFVGLSMHEYLRAGLQYLFRNKSGPLELVFANKPETSRNTGYVFYLHPKTPNLHFRDMVKPVAPNIQYKRSSSEIQIEMPGRVAVAGDPNLEVTFRDSFSEFIEKEMD